ncbi:MAG: GNAT family N-acetyltransferase [Alphaproteobacteria bacterium]|nr:GNAT family N-acetyltransferase [Alphaproteobacteria bacterium]
MARIADTVTYLEMFERPPPMPAPPPHGKLALMRAEQCTVSFYRYLYEAVGEPWLWFERRQWSDEALATALAKPTIEVFVLYVGGVPAGYFELDAAGARETELCYFGLMPEFIGRRLGPFLLNAAIEQAWSRPLERFWVHTCTFDHKRALPLYQRAGFVVFARRLVSFDDPRESGILPRSLDHPLLPPLSDL